MVRSSHRLGAGIIACLILPSCALNTIRLDRASSMGVAGKAATDSSRKVMTDVQAANREVLIDLATIEGHCALPNPVVRMGRSQPDETLCVAGAATPDDLTIKRWRNRDFAPSLAVIDGISAYLGAVDAIVTRKPVDLAASVAEAEAKLRTLSDSITTISGTSPLPAPIAAQTDAISKTLTLLGQIIDEAERVDDLRKLEAGRDQTDFAASLEALDKICDESVDRLDGQLHNQRTLLSLRLKQMSSSEYETRRPLGAQLMATIEQDEATPTLRARFIARSQHSGNLTPTIAPCSPTAMLR